MAIDYKHEKQRDKAKKEGRLKEFLYGKNRLNVKDLNNGYICLTNKSKGEFHKEFIILSEENAMKLLRDLTEVLRIEEGE